MKKPAIEVIKYLGSVLGTIACWVVLIVVVTYLGSIFGAVPVLIVEWSIIGVMLTLTAIKIVRDTRRANRVHREVMEEIEQHTALRDEWWLLHDRQHGAMMAAITKSPYEVRDRLYTEDDALTLDEEARLDYLKDQIVRSGNHISGALG